MKNNGHKNLFFTAIATFLLLFFVEITAYCIYAAQSSSFNFNRYEEQLGKAEGGFGSNKLAAVVGSQAAIHPYFGYTPNPEILTAKDQGGVNISDYGFIDNQSPVHMREPNEVLIGIAGGSVAAWFFIESRGELEAALRRSPIFKKKKLTFINMAAGGWKQPQQLLSLTYLLALGANFDFVINIDGFNDLVMPIYFNLPKSVFPFYPANWYTVSQIATPGFVNPIIDKVKSIGEERKTAANLMKNSLVGGSIAARLIWINYDRLQERRANKLKQEYQEQNILKSSFTTSGPKFTWPEVKKDQYAAMASYWAQSSKQMRLLANANKIRYFHFLQPNQYVSGSKPLSKEELAGAFLPDSQFREIVENGYGAMQKEGELLKKSGENFYDLTSIFKNNHETLYLDPCCHFNKQGLAIMANRIAEAIVSSRQ